MFKQICSHRRQALQQRALKDTRTRLHMQRGASLFTVFILLLLTGLLVLGGLRISVFNESIVGNQADQQRAYAAAEALMQHAANDIYTNGPHCSTENCRYPRDVSDFINLAHTLEGKCGTGEVGSDSPKGVCIPVTPNDRVFQVDYIGKKPNKEKAEAQMISASALNYTSFASTGGNPGSANLALSDNKGQYWVEVFRYSINPSAQFDTSTLPIPDETYPFVFRITVRAEGLKPGTVSVLRSFYVPLPRKVS